jgi:NAD(P)-dependent dehydrogenase (short-subunit alcohol dehydrogenase family)
VDYSVEKEALKNKVILITGASDGIGKQAALTFAHYGATTILLGRTKSKLEQTGREIQAQGHTQPLIIPLDMLKATADDYQQVANLIAAQFTHLDGVLHSAGLLGDITPLENIDTQVFDDVMSVNVRAQLLLTQAILPLIRKSDDARVVFTSSTVGHIGRAGWGSYAISKFATEGMMQVLADELKDTAIRVNAINPGGTRTGMRAQAFPAEDPNTLKTPADIMPLYLYLMAPEGKEVHGQCIDAQPKK